MLLGAIVRSINSFIFSLDHEAQSSQEAVIKHGLETRFPGIRFECSGEVLAGLATSIIPLAGEPHPTEADTTCPARQSTFHCPGVAAAALVHGVHIQAKSSSGRSRARTRSVNVQCPFDDDEPGPGDCERSECPM
jgi:hypothetical protein